MKIVFVTSDLHDPRILKRVEEFYSNGYDVSIYALRRNCHPIDIRPQYNCTIIGGFSNDTPYVLRLPILRKLIKSIKKTESEVCYYLFSLECAMIFRLYHRTCRYIYEECDLVHTSISNQMISNILERIDKKVIEEAVLSVFTSEGFIKYHYGESEIKNSYLIPNKLSIEIEHCPQVEKMACDYYRIGFVGSIRYNAIRNFAKVCCEFFPNIEFHFFGSFGSEQIEREYQSLNNYPNCYFHGRFSKHTDLPGIYSSLDCVLCTYDTDSINVRFAEPNKLYEAIYFETPIIVSRGTFLSEKVERLGIGFSVDALNDREVIDFIQSLGPNTIIEKTNNMRALGKSYAISDNTVFFNRLEQILKQ